MGYRDLSGCGALVTGAGTRIGAQIALHLGQCGCDVAVHFASNGQGAHQVAASIRAMGRGAAVFQADLTDRADVQRLSESVGRHFDGRLHVLVHNAANFERITPDALDASAWDRALALNATAPYLLTLALRQSLQSVHGSVIAIACTSSQRPWRNYVPYSVSKAALVHAVRGLALALAPDVRVNAVAPGAALIPDDYSAEMRERLLKRIPLDRFGDPGDVARAVEFLATNDYLTGQVVTVDGGLSLNGG